MKNTTVKLWVLMAMLSIGKSALPTICPFAWFTENATTFKTALDAEGASGNGNWTASDVAKFGLTECGKVEGEKISLDTYEDDSLGFTPSAKAVTSQADIFETQVRFETAYESVEKIPPCQPGVKAAICAVRSGEKNSVCLS